MAAPPLTPLPIDGLLPELVRTLTQHPCLVLEAPPGAGKTTRVPRALLDAGDQVFGKAGANSEILVLEPRRLAARMSARRVAQELGEPVGERVGYQVRFEDVSSAKTRVRFVTEGLLTRRMLSDPELKGVSAVLLDEFHERHIHTDLALALLRRLQAKRRDLKLVVMSATVESTSIAEYLGAAPILRSEGRRFEVTIEHAPREDDRALAAQVVGAVRRLVQDGLDGDVLVFLPGAAEIRRCKDALEPLAREASLLLATLHGDLSAEEQDRAVRTADRRKIILSTNVAETSVTIEGVVAVVDSGLARVASHSPWSGLPQLRLQRIAQAAAKQRAGRAGRLRPGRCIRLYTQHDYTTRPAYEQPELQRVDLSETRLMLLAGGRAEEVPWFEPPPEAAWLAAEKLLVRLGALASEGNAAGSLTAMGERMARIAAHPRLSRLLLEARARGVGKAGAAIAALLSERDLRRRDAPALRSHTESDVLAELEEFERAERDRLDPRALEARSFDVGAFFAVKRQRDQLLRAPGDGGGAQEPRGDARDTALSLALLAGFPDRLARRRQGRREELVFATGGSGELLPASAVKHAEWMIAIDAEERVSGQKRTALVRAASAVSMDWLFELFVDRIVDQHEVVWNAQTERVDAFRRMRYEDFVIDEAPDMSPDGDAVGQVLFDAARARGFAAFVDAEAFDRVSARIAFLHAHCPELGFALLDGARLDEALRVACVGLRSFKALREADPLALLLASLGDAQRRALDEHAPERLQLPGGRKAPVDYPLGQPPHLSSRLQDFFGMADGPKLARGRVPLVLHLLAPNGRDVQVTTDLKGFWERHYPGIARELRRHYPRHSWPDDPLHATPPPPSAPRRRPK